ncbi:MAG: glycosyltransferase family 4 protein [Planctomycetes bacterium]|nr:glycosyltransferase family 4 protein [Planctomycetota bacterium]
MSEALRIGIDAREAYRPEPRGIGLYTRHLVHALGTVAAGHELQLYHQRTLPPGAFPLPANARAVHTDLPGGRWHSFERLQMPWRMRRDRLSVYHGTYNTLPPRWRWWPGPPMVVTLHDVIVTYWPDDLQDEYVQYVRAVTPRVVRDAALILTVSEWSRRDILERFGAEPQRVRVVRNGLDPAFLAGAPPGAGVAARTEFADGRPYLFSVGAALERKNTGRLIEAFGQLRQRRPDLPHLLLISGVAKVADRFRARAAAAGVLEHVRFLPYLDQAQLIGLYAGAELSIYPSCIEGWGLPVGEALALGTPVLTSNTSAMPEAGGEFARYFDPQSTEALAAGLLEGVEHYAPGFAAVRAAAMARARTFTWQRTAEGVFAAYRSVAR